MAHVVEPSIFTEPGMLWRAFEARLRLEKMADEFVWAWQTVNQVAEPKLLYSFFITERDAEGAVELHAGNDEIRGVLNWGPRPYSTRVNWP